MPPRIPHNLDAAIDAALAAAPRPAQAGARNQLPPMRAPADPYGALPPLNVPVWEPDWRPQPIRFAPEPEPAQQIVTGGVLGLWTARVDPALPGAPDALMRIRAGGPGAESRDWTIHAEGMGREALIRAVNEAIADERRFVALHGDPNILPTITINLPMRDALNLATAHLEEQRAFLAGAAAIPAALAAAPLPDDGDGVAQEAAQAEEEHRAYAAQIEQAQDQALEEMLLRGQNWRNALEQAFPAYGGPPATRALRDALHAVSANVGTLAETLLHERMRRDEMEAALGGAHETIAAAIAQMADVMEMNAKLIALIGERQHERPNEDRPDPA